MKKSKSKYTVEAGRHIYRDGKPYAYLQPCKVEGYFMCSPSEADRLVHDLCALLNSGLTSGERH